MFKTPARLGPGSYLHRLRAIPSQKPLGKTLRRRFT